MKRKYEQFLLLGWLGWFAAVGVTDALCSVINIGAQQLGIIVNDTAAVCMYTGVAVLSGLAVRAVALNARDFRSFSRIQCEELERAMRRLHRGQVSQLQARKD